MPLTSRSPRNCRANLIQGSSFILVLLLLEVWLVRTTRGEQLSYIKDISLPNSCSYTPLMAACGPFVVAVMVPVVCQSYSPIPLATIGHS